MFQASGSGFVMVLPLMYDPEVVPDRPGKLILSYSGRVVSTFITYALAFGTHAFDPRESGIGCSHVYYE
jgi:hypothetical protein